MRDWLTPVTCIGLSAACSTGTSASCSCSPARKLARSSPFRVSFCSSSRLQGGEGPMSVGAEAGCLVCPASVAAAARADSTEAAAIEAAHTSACVGPPLRTRTRPGQMTTYIPLGPAASTAPKWRSCFRHHRRDIAAALLRSAFRASVREIHITHRLGPHQLVKGALWAISAPPLAAGAAILGLCRALAGSSA